MGTQQGQQSPKASLRGSQHGGTVSTSSQSAPQMKLDQFLKWKGWVSTGGEAKQRIQMGAVTVNGAVEIRRGRQLSAGDRVVLDGEESVVEGLSAIGP
jgi:ribosome-associated protein